MSTDVTRQGVGALYVHVPFCRRRCAYCDFATAATRASDPVMRSYVAGLSSLMAELAPLGILTSARSAYVGGGTPSFLGAAALDGLVRAIRGACPVMGELTVEANPDSLDAGMLATLAGAGATRVSVGVQSLDDAVLAALGRVHDAALARSALEAAVASGLAVSADVMCATPYETDDSLARSLETIVGLGVGHVSVYPLAIEEGAPLAVRVEALGGEAPWNEPDLAAARMELAAATLEAAGLARYEVASYARTGLACVHNIAYWTGVPYLGIGAAAASMLESGSYDLARATIAPQLPARPEGAARVRLVTTSPAAAIASGASWRSLHFDVEFLDRAQAVAEDLMLGMRMVAGLGDDLLARARSAIGVAAVDAALERVVARGLAARDNGRLKPTHEGWLLGNELYGELWGLAGGRATEASC